MDAEAVAAWTRALRRCVASRSHAMVDESVVLVFADAPRVFHPAQSLVYDATTDGDDDGDDDDETRVRGGAAPLVVAMRLHSEVSALLGKLAAAGVPTESVDAVVASLVFRDRATAVANAAANEATLRAHAPFFASRSVNVDGGALRLYGESQQSAAQALAMATRAITGNDERLATDLRRLILVVEHRDGYLARDFTVSSASSGSHSQPVFPRLMTIQKREWDSGSIAQLSLDDALEAYEAAFNEEQEINGDVDAMADVRSLEISVKAAFEVREQARSVRASAFLVDDDASGTPLRTGVPPVVLFSQWTGLENVRDLVCKPPPQSASALCFSGEGLASATARLPGSRLSLVLLQHLDQAVRESSDRTWKSLPGETTAADIIQDFKRFLRNIDQDDSEGNAGDGDDTTNNTIESTISLALDGEHKRAQGAASRADLDPVEKLWDFLARNTDGTDLTKQLVQEFVVFLSNTRIFPAPHPDNDTQLAKLVRLRQDEIQGTTTTTSFATAAQQMLTQHVDACASLIEAGEWTMKRDVAYSMAQAGFSSHECSEFLRAIPRFDVDARAISHSHWKAMDHVLQLCMSGLSVHLPVSFMRKAVHDCVAYHSRSGITEASVDPSVLVDLQSFIPDRLRASIADPLYWDLRIAFNEDFEHRLRICQDTFHPTVRSPSHSQISLEPEGLVFDDPTLRALHRNTPAEVLLQNDVIQFISKLDDDREKRLFEQLHDIDMPMGMMRYDCTVRRLHMFP